MTKSGKILLLVLTFAACITVGFICGKVVSSNVFPNKSAVSATYTPVKDLDIVEQTEADVLETPLVEPELKIEIPSMPELVSKPERLPDGKYKFTVHSEGNDVEYVLSLNEEGIEERCSQPSGTFCVEAPSGGKFYVFARNSAGTSDCVCVEGFVQKVKKITQKELLDVIHCEEVPSNSFRVRLSRNIVLKFNNYNDKEDDEKPTTIDEIRNRIKYVQWKNVSVQDMMYDDDDRLSMIVFSIIYPQDSKE